MHKASIIEALKLSELHDGCYAVNSLNKLRLDNLTIGTEYVIVGAVKSTKSIYNTDMCGGGRAFLSKKDIYCSVLHIDGEAVKVFTDKKIEVDEQVVIKAKLVQTNSNIGKARVVFAAE